MSETPSGRPRAPALKIKTKSSDADEFAVQFRNYLSPQGVFVRTSKPLAVGRAVRFEYLLSDGTPAVSGSGHVAWTRGAPAVDTPAGDNPAGMGIAIEELTKGADVLGAAGEHRWGAPSMFQEGAAQAHLAPPTAAVPSKRPAAASAFTGAQPVAAQPPQAAQAGPPQGALGAFGASAASLPQPPPAGPSSRPPPAPVSLGPAPDPSPAPSGALFAGPALTPTPINEAAPALAPESLAPESAPPMPIPAQDSVPPLSTLTNQAPGAPPPLPPQRRADPDDLAPDLDAIGSGEQLDAGLVPPVSAPPQIDFSTPPPGPDPEDLDSVPPLDIPIGEDEDEDEYEDDDGRSGAGGRSAVPMILGAIVLLLLGAGAYFVLVGIPAPLEPSLGPILRPLLGK